MYFRIRKTSLLTRFCTHYSLLWFSFQKSRLIREEWEDGFELRMVDGLAKFLSYSAGFCIWGLNFISCKQLFKFICELWTYLPLDFGLGRYISNTNCNVGTKFFSYVTSVLTIPLSFDDYYDVNFYMVGYATYIMIFSYLFLMIILLNYGMVGSVACIIVPFYLISIWTALPPALKNVVLKYYYCMLIMLSL